MTGERHIIGIGREVTARRKDGTHVPRRTCRSRELTIEGETKFTGIVRDLTERVKLGSEAARGVWARADRRAGGRARARSQEPAGRGERRDSDARRAADRARKTGRSSQEILRRLDGLGAMMGDLLLYARPPQPQLRPIDRPELVAASVRVLQARTRRGVTSSVGSYGRHPGRSGGPRAAKVAFQNLLLNAVQAMHGRRPASVCELDASRGHRGHR